MANEIKCYQCMDKGIISVPMLGSNGITYDYMFRCSCGKGYYFTQLPQIDIQVAENREFLKKLAAKNYEKRKTGGTNDSRI